MAGTVESSAQPSATLQPESEASAAPAAAPPKTPQNYSDENRGSVTLQIARMLHLLSLSPEPSPYARRRATAAEGAFQCRTCGRSFPSFQALGGHRSSHARPQVQRFATFQALGGHRTSHMRPRAERVATFQGNIAGGEGFSTTGGDTGGARSTTTDQVGVRPSSRDHVSLPIADLEALLARTAENSNGDDEGGTVNAKKISVQVDPADHLGGKEDPADYTSPMVGIFAVAIALRASSMASYPVLEKALGPKFARLAYDFPWVLIFILGVGLLVNVAFDRSPRARIFGKYALLLAIATILCVATWFWAFFLHA